MMLLANSVRKSCHYKTTTSNLRKHPSAVHPTLFHQHGDNEHIRFPFLLVAVIRSATIVTSVAVITVLYTILIIQKSLSTWSKQYFSRSPPSTHLKLAQDILQI